MSYVLELRQLVGTRPLILVSAGALIFDPVGQVLLQRRTDDGQWSLPGGAMEPGETLEETARREVREETGLEVSDLKLLGLHSGSEFFHTYPNGDQAFIVSATYVAHEICGTPMADGVESVEVRFFDIPEVPKNLSRVARSALAMYQAGSQP